MDGIGILFLITTLLLIGLLVFIKFSKTGQSFVCPACPASPASSPAGPACPACPSSQRIGLKYKSTNDELVNDAINNLNTTIDSVQSKYMTCSKMSDYIKESDIPAAGTKCDDFRKTIEAQQFPTGQKDADDAQKNSIDYVMKKICLSDGTIDHDKLAASSKILQKTFCV